MKIIKYGLLFVSICLFVGCSSKYPVTFNSNPKGAVLVCSGKNWGYTPKTLYYDKKVKELESLDISDCSANWVSGYSKNYGIIPIQQFPNGVQQTLTRPFGNGYEKDAQFALQIEKAEYQRRQTRANERAASAQQRQVNQQLYNSFKPKFYNVTPNVMGGYNIIQY